MIAKKRRHYLRYPLGIIVMQLVIHQVLTLNVNELALAIAWGADLMFILGCLGAWAHAGGEV